MRCRLSPTADRRSHTCQYVTFIRSPWAGERDTLTKDPSVFLHKASDSSIRRTRLPLGISIYIASKNITRSTLPAQKTVTKRILSEKIWGIRALGPL